MIENKIKNTYILNFKILLPCLTLSSYDVKKNTNDNENETCRFVFKNIKKRKLHF